LLVPDALADQEWNANPDIKLGMISYMGFPVAWPNGDIFGTICVLDSRRNEYNELYKKFLLQCRDVLQADLTSLQATNELELKVLERTAELRRSEVYLTEAQKLSRTGSFGWNVKSGDLFWSDESFRIFGYDKALSPTVDMALQRVHPDDLALVRRTIERASSDGKDIDLEYRLRLPDGTVKNIRVVARAVRDAAGQLEFNGALMDVTAAKRAEEELIRAHAELARAARVTTLGELTASIAHEINQPLGAMVANGNAGLALARDTRCGSGTGRLYVHRRRRSSCLRGDRKHTGDVQERRPGKDADRYQQARSRYARAHAWGVAGEPRSGRNQTR
jgi:PAS domain S-box-containing protein